MKYSVWMEGYSIMEGNSDARHLGDYEANSFFEACKLAADDYSNFGKYYPEDNTIWGCRLFDNEKDARKSFG